MFMNFKTLTVTHRNLLGSLICFIINLIVEDIVCWTNQHKPSQAHLHLLELFGGVWHALLLGGGRPEGNSHSAHEPLLVRVHLHHLAEPEVALPHLPLVLQQADIPGAEVRHPFLPLGEGKERVKCLGKPQVPVIFIVELGHVMRAGGSPAKQQEVGRDGEDLVCSLVVVSYSQYSVFNIPKIFQDLSRRKYSNLGTSFLRFSTSGLLDGNIPDGW